MSGECPQCGLHALECECTHTLDANTTGDIMEWISVKTTLPTFDLGYVLIYVEDDEMGCYKGTFTSIWEKGRFNDWPPNCGCTGFGKVTHWMPLPSPPITLPVVAN